MRRCPSRRDGEAGQSAAEFSLVVLPLLVLVFAIMQLGLVFGKHLDLTSATREGARKAAVSMDRDDPVTLAEQEIRTSLGLVDADDVEISVTPPPPWEHGDTITVTTSVPAAYDLFGLGAFDGDLTSRAEIRVE